MRSNLPVTQRDYPLPAGKTLVSVTDLKGRIVYCNEAFIDVSGYTRDELLGQAHNIVRHPDMPEEAFRDMWATIEGGRPWSALVKNRRKNGDHYWVHANATPIRDGDRTAGYLSVRSAPQPEQVAQAEALYAEMRREAEGGKLRTRLHHGQVVRAGLVGRLAQGLSAAATHLGLSGLMGLFASLGTGVAAMFTGPAVWVPVAVGLFAAAHLMGRRADRQGLQRVLDDMLRLAAGDLTHDVKVTQAGTLGELQLATAQLAANLRTVIGDIRTEVENVRGAVAEISAGNLDLSSRTEAQAASLEQTAASMEEINGTVRQSAASATQGATLAAQTMTVAERSHDSVLGVVQAMEDINKSAAQVGAIIHVIESVAFQTNILAL
ncbi:MAG: PAS domain S-box protein, partial [Rhodoferax sp.]|nr:PAS domain S-box protein [Rhodoferax sp.]